MLQEQFKCMRTERRLLIIYRNSFRCTRTERRLFI